MIISDPVCYSLNSISLGDVIAAAPVVKYAVETFHEKATYHLLARPYYFDLFDFVPKDKLGDQSQPFSCTVPWQIRYLNTPRTTNARTTSMHMHLSTFASIQLLNRIIPDEFLNYLPLPKVDVSHFNIDFSKAVLIIVTFRDDVRRISYETVKGISDYAVAKGLTPVYIGKVDSSEIWKDSPFKLAFDNAEMPSGGVSLLNKTTILELASIMDQSYAVVGLDSGPIHLAGTTSVPIICGYTTVSPVHRFPRRKKGIFKAIAPKIDCIHCQSNWSLNYYDFGFCYFKHYDCLKQMTADKFISALESL